MIQHRTDKYMNRLLSIFDKTMLFLEANIKILIFVSIIVFLLSIVFLGDLIKEYGVTPSSNAYISLERNIDLDDIYSNTVVVTPPSNWILIENEKGLAITGEISELNDDRISVEYTDGQLIITGEYKSNTTAPIKQIFFKAFAVFPSRMISTYANFDVDNISCKIKNRILLIHIPKVSPAKEITRTPKRLIKIERNKHD